MSKKQTIKFLKEDHAKLELVLEALTDEMMMGYRITGTWTIKDILAHISAWNKELIKAVNMLLRDEKPWFADIEKNELKISEGEFNKIQIVKRKSMSLKEIIEEWEQSFDNLLKKIRSLSDNEWEYKTEFKWQEGSEVTVKSLFGYRYRGHGHEGGHAQQIEEYFDRDNCACEIY